MNQVCPDRQLLSVYFDGELPSPWKEKMEAHIAGCPCCSQRLKAYQRISITASPMAKTTDTAAMETARERLWQKLERRNGVTAPVVYSQYPAIWRRRVSVPLPAAAAILLLIAMAFLFFSRSTETETVPGMLLVSETEFETPGIIPVANMEDVLQYLGGRDSSELIILRLPESRNFVSYSEPAIIRAADYSRTTSKTMPVRRDH